MKRLAIALFALLVTLTAAAADKQPLTHETLYLMKRVGAPAVSPDGRWAVFSVTEPSYDEKEQVADLWIAAVDGSSKPRKLTSLKTGESDALWSPDGKRVLYIHDSTLQTEPDYRELKEFES